MKKKTILTLLVCVAFSGGARFQSVSATYLNRPAISRLVSLSGSITLSTVDQIFEDVKLAPCNNNDREAAGRALLEKMGAASTSIEIEKYKDVEDIVFKKPGSEPGTIIVGAHYDKVRDGCGAIDNWTGVVTVAHLLRSIQNVKTNKTVWFVLFGREEAGLIGSAAMVKALGKENLKNVCAMINIDSTGLAIPQVGDNMSTQKLEHLAEADAKAMKMPFGHAVIQGGDADSSSFKDKGVPSITIHGLSQDWPKILHSDHDMVKAIKPGSVYLCYRLALAVLMDVDAAPCDKYR